MYKTIPEQRIFVCDCCQQEGVHHAKGTKLILKRNALDYQGQPVADGTVELDLCDECDGKVSEAINAVCIEVRKVES